MGVIEGILICMSVKSNVLLTDGYKRVTHINTNTNTHTHTHTHTFTHKHTHTHPHTHTHLRRQSSPFIQPGASETTSHTNTHTLMNTPPTHINTHKQYHQANEKSKIGRAHV